MGKKKMTREELDRYFDDVELVDEPEPEDAPEPEPEAEAEVIKLTDDDGPVVVTYGGVEITVKPEMLGDMRTLYLMGKVNKRSVPVVEKLGYYNDLLELIIAGDLYEVYNAIAAENGGKMSADEMGDFIKAVLEAAGAKN